MMKYEFEKIIGKVIPTKEYEIIETVYVYYPGIDHAFGKEQVADLYRVYGLRIFEDLLPRAQAIQGMESRIHDKEKQIEQLKKELTKL